MAKSKKVVLEEVEPNWLAIDTKYASKRFVRALVAVVIAGVVSQYGDSQYFMVLAPVLNAVSKFIRDRYGIDVRVI